MPQNVAIENDRKSRLRLVLVIIILSLILLGPFVVYYHWRSPRLHSEGLSFTPNPMLRIDSKDGGISHKCPSCPRNITVLVPAPQKEYVDQSRCSFEQPFTVYVYKDNVIPVRYTSDIADVEAVLKMTSSLADTPTKACLFLCVIGPSQSFAGNEDISDRLSSLPYWNKGLNHVLVDIPEVGSISPTVTNSSSALLAKGISLNSLRYDFTHIITPPVPHSRTKLPSPALYHSSRTHVLYFEGESTEVISTAWLDSKLLLNLNFNVKFSCKHAGGVIHNGYDGEWGLCTDHNQRLQNCADSRFSLVLSAPHTSAITYVRVIESLQCGAVPVIVGVKQLPFDNVIKWNKAGILLPVLSSPRDLDTLLRSFQPETLMEYRRQGRFLHETYFSSRMAVLHTIIAILRSRLMHPPPAAQEFSGKVFRVNNDHSKIPASPRFLHNHTIYSESLWNSAPGPFYMYPVTPYRSPYVPEMFNKPSDNLPDNLKPPILKGDTFSSTLHGIHPSEGFTVVALTYHRYQHLAEFVKGFEGCTFLAKIVIVWNDEKEPNKGFKLPDIGVPIEVVTTGKNSLNNRFLPFSNIETEAILTVDDDQKIPLGEIQLAFRVWRENRDRIVGWYDRFVYWNPRKQLWYYSWDVSCEPSLVLTGAAFYHKYYNYLYSYWMPQSIRDVVDQSMNGEDLAMNFLITYISRKPPVKIDSKSNLHGCSNCGSSISTQSNHLVHRSKCVNEFVRIWGHNSLLGTQFRTEPALEGQCLTNM